MKMKAFHGNKELAATRLAAARHHVEADMLIKGTYGKGIGADFKGCSIGCLYGDPKTGAEGTHERGEKMDGIPRELLRLVDDLFESLPEHRRKSWHKSWHIEWVRACADVCGADLSLVWHQYDYWIIHDPVDGIVALAKQNDNQELVDLIDKYEPLLHRASAGDMPTEVEFGEAAREAWEAREARAAWGAWVARAARTARTARAAREARAAWEAREARGAWVAWGAREAWGAWAEKQADKLIELIRASK